MEQYKKPVVLMNEELAEGVYAASGAVTPDQPQSGGVSVAGLRLTEQGNEYYKVNKYMLNIQNSGGEASTDWSVSLPVTSGTATSAQVYNGQIASASVSGNIIIVTAGAGDARIIPAGGSIEVEVIVSYSSASITIG